MKKITLFLAILAFFSMQAFSQSNDPRIDSFLNSSEYSRISFGAISEFGDVDIDNCSVFTEENGPVGQYVVNIVFGGGGGFDGVVQAVRLPAQYNNVLPGNEHYIMILYDYRAYDTLDKTGDITLVDLNYDNWIPLEMAVVSGTMTNLSTQFMPDSIVEKYSYLLKKRDLGNPIYDEETMVPHHYCDKNGNGNVSYGECFSCMVSACNSNQNCAILCGIVNVAGVFLMRTLSCSASISASCVWIAIFY